MAFCVTEGSGVPTIAAASVPGAKGFVWNEIVYTLKAEKGK